MTLAEQTLPVFDHMLGTLDGLLGKAAENGGDALLAARLAPDMHPLATQVRFSCSQVVTGLQRLTKFVPSEDEADDATLAAARARIAGVRRLASETAAGDFVAGVSLVEFTLPNGMTFAMTAAEYARDWVIPQFYFHVVSAYAILRQQGLAIGKADYVPYMSAYFKAAAPA